ncbi:putative secreted protein (Por secretion system target) [Chryseobacterium sp. 52]|uniref:T9SS type A sorting domain-containing protein n=1 Tax=Chryseobacterium sp. 52 TaxID=2035213 RepID=UPI000C1A2BD7|nr:T9SS type A sorting domain-containing protein [Chryseobacterium sp. 52]PIF44972.1 putative secreted protein (Por secretion system target) [Chryseobacterium sp. 52]
MKKLLLTCLFFLIATIVNAQITLGSGTTTGAYPIASNFGYNYTQQIISKAKINAAGPGSLSGLKFYLPANANLDKSNQWEVFVGHTTLAAFAGTTAASWIATTAMTQVFTGVITNNAGVVEVTFTTPFAYNNVDNLVIAVHENTPNFNSSTDYFYTSASGTTNSSMYYRNDTTDFNPAVPVAAGSRAATLSNITLLGLTPNPVPSCPAVSAPAAAATGVSVMPTITWGAINNATGYKLSIGTTAGGTDVMNNTDVGNVVTYTLSTPLNFNTQYYYTVNAYNGAIPSAGCSERSFTTSNIACPVVSAPTSAATGVSITPTITWATVAGATGYKLKVGTTAGGSDILNNADLGNVTSYVFSTPLANSTKYYYTVNAYSGAVTSSSCTERNFTTLCGAVSAPFLESFNTGVLPGCWSNASTNNTSYALWQFTGTQDYGTTGNGASGTVAFIDASSPYTGVHDVTLTTPQINLAGLTTPYVQFKWFKNHAASAGGSLPAYDNNQLTVQVKNVTGTTWETIFTSSTNSTLWRTEGVVLSAAYNGATVQVRFVVDKDVAGNGYFYDNLLLDDVEVKEAPTCLSPTVPLVTATTTATATIGWTAPATVPGNGYDIYYSTSSTAPTAASTPNATAITGTSYVINNAVAGTLYYAWVRSRCSANDQSSWIGSVTFALVPTNDDCGTAVGLTVNPDLACAATTAGNTVGATNSNVPVGTCSGTPDDDVWYSFVATSTLHTVTLSNVVSTGSISSTSLYTQVFSGACGALASVQCGTANTTNVSGLTAGQTYYVRVYNSNGAGYNNSFNICIGTPPPPPVNDVCSGAIALTVGGTFNTHSIVGTNVSATTDGTTTCQTSRANNVWYSVVVPASGSVTVETAAVTGSGFIDSVLSAHTGVCGSLVSAGCNDDVSAGTNNFSKVTLTGQTPGSTIYFSVWRYSSGAGVDGQFQISAYDASLLATSEVSGAKNDLKVYPNPFADVLNISDISKVKSVSIVDLAGRLVKTIDNPSSALQLGDLKQGLYLVTLNMKDGSKQTIKAIKK